MSRGVEVSRRDAQRWRLVKKFHPLLRLEHWDGHGWGPLYGEAADKIVDELILGADSGSDVKLPKYRFGNVTCSQCGGEFGPGNNGFSYCENHKHLPRLG
jgi:hypothetical protein